ncbi:pentapeptide repeat-containing protein [Azospirillum canadense]|uniref:pentapeptide repeat-containing protein n=1 Tax=Azospirillum canadense TaxID=403962 RepID=UPI0022277226|nr:pentapeptide repeat-containing protein [Azospirillum canadense]MCW2240672.1 uncharacterized protein YjbI with pentapeptide repeats [Azospirillum canadense]
MTSPAPTPPRAHQPDLAAVVDALREHDVWVHSECRQGVRLDWHGLDLSHLSDVLIGRTLVMMLARCSILTGTRLDHALLHGADLSYADLRAGRLPGARLLGARLTAACLSGADLRGARCAPLVIHPGRTFCTDLSGALLRTADLRDADLRDANLTGADLRGADLRGANLAGAILTDTRLDNALLDDPPNRRHRPRPFAPGLGTPVKPRS